MNPKRKFQNKWHPILFLIIWIIIFALTWMVSLVAYFELLSFLPRELRYEIRMLIPFATRSMLKSFALPIIGLVFAALQWACLNRAFALRINFLWIIFTALGYALGFSLMQWSWGMLLDLPNDFLRSAIPYALWMLTPALMQWLLIRNLWPHAWLWLITAIISGVAILTLITNFPITGNMFYDALMLWDEGVLIGILHGFITGLAIVLMDKLKQPKLNFEMALFITKKRAGA